VLAWARQSNDHQKAFKALYQEEWKQARLQAYKSDPKKYDRKYGISYNAEQYLQPVQAATAGEAAAEIVGMILRSAHDEK